MNEIPKVSRSICFLSCARLTCPSPKGKQLLSIPTRRRLGWHQGRQSSISVDRRLKIVPREERMASIVIIGAGFTGIDLALESLGVAARKSWLFRQAEGTVLER